MSESCSVDLQVMSALRRTLCRPIKLTNFRVKQLTLTLDAGLLLTLDAGLLARSQYPEGPATGHLDTGFSWFPCVYKRMLRWFPSFQVATTCFSCSPPDLNLLVTFFFSYLCTCKTTTATGWQPNCSLLLLLLILKHFEKLILFFFTFERNGLWHITSPFLQPSERTLSADVFNVA